MADVDRDGQINLNDTVTMKTQWLDIDHPELNTDELIAEGSHLRPNLKTI